MQPVFRLLKNFSGMRFKYFFGNFFPSVGRETVEHDGIQLCFSD